MLQSLAVAAIVTAAAAYATWALMPARWRGAIARRLGWRAPAAGCGGCDSCAADAPPAAARESVITVHRTRG